MDYECARGKVRLCHVWLDGRIEIRIDGFRGGFQASLLASDIAQLHFMTDALARSPSSTVRFEACESCLRMKIGGDGEGQFFARGEANNIEARNRPAVLFFEIRFDQAGLSRIIRECEDILRESPAWPFRQKV